ncbi:MAG: hypothetical protein JXQ93_12990 [Flavobacteriaceae bacterium]
MKRLFSLTLIFMLLLSCVNSENTDEFIKNTEGRYLFNSDETIEIYYVDKELRVKWRGKDMVPIKANDSSFYLKEMNEKLVFVTAPNIHIELAPKREHDGEKFSFTKLAKGEKTPAEYLATKEYDKALKGYLRIKQKDSLDPTIRERVLNRLGYNKIAEKKYDEAIEIFKINVALYPYKSNPYDSLGEAYWYAKDTANSVMNFKKALAINPENRGAKRFIKRHNIK